MGVSSADGHWTFGTEPIESEFVGVVRNITYKTEW